MNSFRNSKPKFKRELSAPQCEQIDIWIREQKLTEEQIVDAVKEQFNYPHLSKSALNRYSNELRLKDALDARRRQAQAQSDPAPKVPEDFLASIQKRAMDSLEDPKSVWTPGRLLQLQRIALEAWRRQITENRERRAEELKAITALNAQTRIDFATWRKNYALIKASIPEGFEPNPELLEEAHRHPLNRLITEELEEAKTASYQAIDQSQLPRAYSIPTSLPEENFGVRQLAAAFEPSPTSTPQPCQNTFPQESPHPLNPATPNALAPSSIAEESTIQPPSSALPEASASAVIPSTPPVAQPVDLSTFPPKTAAAIKRALKTNPFWRVPTTPEELHAACTQYVQLRDDERNSKYRSPTTQYKYCPCGGPLPCPLHGDFPAIFWETPPTGGDFVAIMEEKGLTYDWPKTGGACVLVEPSETPESSPKPSRLNMFGSSPGFKLRRTLS